MRKESDLHGYQLRGIKHIIDNNHVGMFIGLGLGKTITTLTAIKRLMYEELDVRKVLVVAPKRVAENVWHKEVEEWEHLRGIKVSVVKGTEKQRKKALDKKADIYTISRDMVVWLQELYFGKPFPFDMLVVDESSSFKTPSSKRFKALRKLQPFFKRVVLLTGTPAPNTLMDLWPQIFLLDRGERLGKTLTRYREQYFKPDKMNGHVVYSYKLRDGAEKQIHERIDDICISMKAKDYLDLKGRVDNYVKVDMGEGQYKAYEELEKEMLLGVGGAEGVGDGGGVEITALSAAALSMKLQQFANGALYDENGEAHVVHDKKLEALDDILEGAVGKSVLVAWTFKSDRDRIMQRLGVKKLPNGTWQRGGEVRELHDGVDIEDWNEGKVRVLLMHPASGGHGLNLQKGGNTIVWFGVPWSLELYQQFNGRLDRQGQEEVVVVHHLISEGTVDEDVLKRLESKDKRQDALVEALKVRREKYLKSF